MNIDMPPFYIGQEVIALHTTVFFKKGHECTITSMRKCSCGIWLVSFGMASGEYRFLICDCGHETRYTQHSQAELAARVFAPKHQLGEFISMKELMEKELETIGTN